MVDGVTNPYRTDRVAEDFFVGRDDLLGTLLQSARTGRNSIHAVMGGRGMGKSSLARQIARRYGREATVVVSSGGAARVEADVSKALGAPLEGAVVESLVRAVETAASRRVLLVLDEVERLLEDPGGIGLLDNLREAYERADGALAVFVLGGTKVQDLLRGNASPFLRIAGGVHTLTGLTFDETARLVRAPLGLDVRDDVLEALHAETAGHPWLIQMFMEGAVDLAPRVEDVVACIPRAIHEVERQRLGPIAFPLWWTNLQTRGQELYQRLSREAAPMPRPRWVERFGDDPSPWVEVLRSTGVAALEVDAVIARGTLFHRWVEGNHTLRVEETLDDELARWLAGVGADPLETVVVRCLATWARSLVEFPAAAARSDNSVLLPEAYFQMHALLQHERDLTAQPEALSVRPAGRSDIKVQSRRDPTRRACIEFKVFGRDDATVVRQAIGYAMPEDPFAVVVSIDRCKRPLLPEYEARCFDDASAGAREVRPKVSFPTLRTAHERPGCAPLRVWHFLIQLRDS